MSISDPLPGLAFLGNYAVVYLTAVGIKNVYVILMICERRPLNVANESIRRDLRQYYCRFLDPRSSRTTNSASVDWLCPFRSPDLSWSNHHCLSSSCRCACVRCGLLRLLVQRLVRDRMGKYPIHSYQRVAFRYPSTSYLGRGRIIRRSNR